MKRKEQLYKIILEDYSIPRCYYAPKAYYGTMEDITNLMNRLSENDDIRKRYLETIQAVEHYDSDPTSTHTIAGQVVPILTPGLEFRRFETQLTKHSWDYTGINGNIYPCYASKIDVCQSLIRTDDGYEHCLKAVISGLYICHQGIGWMPFSGSIKGFPGIVTWGGNHHTMNLFVSQAHYDFDEVSVAVVDMADVSLIDMSAITADILAEG